MANTTNYNWETPDDTDLVKDGAAAIRTLGSSIDTTTKALNPSTTLGDIEYRSSTANTNTRLPIGTTGQILTVAGGVPSWGAAPASGGMTLLSTTTMSGTSVVLSSINQSYKRLMLVGVSINRTSTSSTRIYPQDGTTDLDLQYSWTSGDNQTNVNSAFALYPDNNNGYMGTAKPLNFVLTIDNYASTTQQKPFLFYGGYDRSSPGVRGFNVIGASFSNNKIDKITISADYAFNAGTVYTYGVN